ncbi:hypothetical protein SNEBB_010417 [Seison nebaliae]|nr:hypothetical protein SNEBB_010417 [Seison nebaliae]
MLMALYEPILSNQWSCDIDRLNVYECVKDNEPSVECVGPTSRTETIHFEICPIMTVDEEQEVAEIMDQEKEVAKEAAETAAVEEVTETETKYDASIKSSQGLGYVAFLTLSLIIGLPIVADIKGKPSSERVSMHIDAFADESRQKFEELPKEVQTELFEITKLVDEYDHLLKEVYSTLNKNTMAVENELVEVSCHCQHILNSETLRHFVFTSSTEKWRSTFYRIFGKSLSYNWSQVQRLLDSYQSNEDHLTQNQLVQLKSCCLKLMSTMYHPRNRCQEINAIFNSLHSFYFNVISNQNKNYLASYTKIPQNEKNILNNLQYNICFTNHHFLLSNRHQTIKMDQCLYGKDQGSLTKFKRSSKFYIKFSKFINFDSIHNEYDYRNDQKIILIILQILLPNLKNKKNPTILQQEFAVINLAEGERNIIFHPNRYFHHLLHPLPNGILSVYYPLMGKGKSATTATIKIRTISSNISQINTDLENHSRPPAKSKLSEKRKNFIDISDSTLSDFFQFSNKKYAFISSAVFLMTTTILIIIILLFKLGNVNFVKRKRDDSNDFQNYSLENNQTKNHYALLSPTQSNGLGNFNNSVDRLAGSVLNSSRLNTDYCSIDINHSSPKG